MQLKPAAEQVVVVLGASSGVGREVALRFADRGAKVVVAARSEPGLTSLVQGIEARGGAAAHAVCDVADPAQVEGVAHTAASTFGRIDTWVNVAAASVYARFEDTTPEEFRRVTEVNYLGQVHGALAALPHLRRAGQGTLIAISSVESIVSLPLHSAYAASKHAVEGMVAALRRDLLAEGVPVSVTSVQPATINTPFFNNSLNKMDVKPKGPPPVYQPGVVAECVFYAAEHPVRDLYAGGAARMMAVFQMLAPGTGRRRPRAARDPGRAHRRAGAGWRPRCAVRAEHPRQPHGGRFQCSRPPRQPLHPAADPPACPGPCCRAAARNAAAAGPPRTALGTRPNQRR